VWVVYTYDPVGCYVDDHEYFNDLNNALIYKAEEESKLPSWSVYEIVLKQIQTRD